LVGEFGAPQQISTRFTSWLRYTAAKSLTGGQPNSPLSLAVSWAGTLYVHFRRLLPPDGNFCHVQKIHVASHVLRSPIYIWQRYCTALEQPASAKICGRATRNGITELSQRAPPIFGWAAITQPYTDARLTAAQLTESEIPLR